jgi:hypothetical protein
MARWSGWAAIGGGALRIVDSFARFESNVLAALYLLTDVLLLTGLAGIWLARRTALGVAGHLGMAVAAAGLFRVRAAALGFGSYPLGASVTAIGLAIYSAEALLRRNAIVAPLLWLTAFGLGVPAAGGIAPEALMAAAGTAFGLGFIAAGVQSSLAVR